MGVDVRRVDVLEVPRRTCVRRWRTGRGGGHTERHVSLGWAADGRWWVEGTRQRLGWVFTGPPGEARAAAEAQAAELMADGVWEPVIATYEPGVHPPVAAEVPEWPPGHEPG